MISKFKLELQGKKRLMKRKSIKFNIDLLKNENIRNKYTSSIDIHLKDNNVRNIEMNWNEISLVIKEAIELSIGRVLNGNKKNNWYN